MSKMKMGKSSSPLRPTIATFWKILGRRSHFTLVEVLVVITIVTFVAGVVAIGIQGIVQQQRFRNEVDLVVDELRLAQDLMLVANADVKVHFKRGEKGLQMQLDTDAALTAGWTKTLTKAKRNLKTLTIVEFEGQKEPFTLNFLSGGAVMSRGVLKLYAPREPERFICLLGYPHPITATSQSQSCVQEEEPQKDSRMTFFTKRAIEQEKFLPDEQERKATE